MALNVNDFEHAVMEKLLYGEDPVLEILRGQFTVCNVSNREYTGVGFFTTFSLPPDCPRVPGNKTFSFGDVLGAVEGLVDGAGFVLHVKDGLLHYLEGYTYDEKWPKEIHSFTLAYQNGPKRNLSALRANWS